ncbi:hypothetical protein G9A89_002540 [Geosiphon pyriformis]|nr:hypothetical protein G9A89_002540 [Geosiphon pyriformis]
MIDSPFLKSQSWNVLSRHSPFPPSLGSYSEWNVSTFDPLIFIYFSIAFIIIPYPLYRFFAGVLSWERTLKTPAKHFGDVMALFRYGFIVFVLGGYSKTFDLITIISFYVAIFAYARIAEIPFTQTSLPCWRTWALAMWILFIAALAIILGFAAYHIYLAFIAEEIKNTKTNGEFAAWYLCCLSIPIILILVALSFQKEQNEAILKDSWINIKLLWSQCGKKENSQGSGGSGSGSGGITGGNVSSSEENLRPIVVSSETPVHTLDGEANAIICANYGALTSDPAEIPIIPPIPQETRKKVRIHLHHWQIFYVLAFFTRFEDLLSRIASGIVLGIYTQGIAA